MVVKAELSIKSKREIISKLIKRVTSVEVLVGIPSTKTHRQNDVGGITNAELLYIHTHGIRATSMRNEMQSNLDNGEPYSAAYALYVQSHGSPLWHSPPRPVLEPAIENNKDTIANMLKEAIKCYLHRGGDMRGFRLTGNYAVGICKGWFENPQNGWPPNSIKTIEKKNSDLPLVDTGALRQSITYVLKDGGVEC